MRKKWLSPNSWQWSWYGKILANDNSFNSENFIMYPVAQQCCLEIPHSPPGNPPVTVYSAPRGVSGQKSSRNPTENTSRYLWGVSGGLRRDIIAESQGIAKFQFRYYFISFLLIILYKTCQILSKHPQQVNAKNIEKSAPSKPSNVFSM